MQVFVVMNMILLIVNEKNLVNCKVANIRKHNSRSHFKAIYNIITTSMNVGTYFLNVSN